MEQFFTPAFLTAVFQIILIDILLGGDNAILIALACRNLPAKQRLQGIIWGTAGAILLRVILIFFALKLLEIPYLKIIGALLLIWIGIKLLVGEDEGGHEVNASDRLWGAVKTIIIADLVMSVDNVIGIAGAAQGAGQAHQLPLVIFGLLVSVPIIVWGSTIVLKLIDKYPWVITVGAAILGWIAGDMFYTDKVMGQWGFDPKNAPIHYAFKVGGAALVVGVGLLLKSKRTAAKASSAS
jgi:YjbE family integral membrane protein